MGSLRRCEATAMAGAMAQKAAAAMLLYSLQNVNVNYYLNSQRGLFKRLMEVQLNSPPTYCSRFKTHTININLEIRSPQLEKNIINLQPWIEVR